MEDAMFDDKNIMVMKLLHYFITEKNYNPIILQGVENEIWLENLNEDYQVVRIVSGYIHNNEQFDFDTFKTKRIMKKIKRKTMSFFNMNVASFFLNLNDNVDLEAANTPNSFCVKVTEESDIKKNEMVAKAFPDLTKKLKFTEKGAELFMKITGDINKHNQEDAKKIEKVFKAKFPMITYCLIALNLIVYFVPYLFGESQGFLLDFCVHGPSIRYGQYYRLITGTFIHSGLMHLAFNCYSLYIIGSQLESFLGKAKYTVIYFMSALFGSLLSMTFNGNTASVGASGAIFGLMGALLYFGYHYRVYLGNVLKSQIIPLILVNLLLGFIVTGVDNAAHIGGLIGGALVTMALGVKNKSSWFEELNGWIITLIFLAFTIYLAFVYAV
ncbi:MAG: rhomboid family intramembrane serine protease [Mycoplasmatota bacterium]|nr:rhomboid family intramembrane serine protease [Mycoplasmatota bacterium]